MENGELGILEIKCIYSQRDDEKIDLKKVKYLDKNGKLRIKNTYYTQIQLNCWLVGAKFAYLFLYTDHDCKVIPVDVDMDFS